MNVDTRRADRHTHAELSKSEENRMKEFVRTALSYDGNPKKVWMDSRHSIYLCPSSSSL